MAGAESTVGPVSRPMAGDLFTMSASEASRGTGLCFRARAVTKIYNPGPAAVHALRGVDLTVPRGSIFEVHEFLGPK